MQSYLDLLKHVMTHGTDRTDRTGTGTRSVFGYQWRHDLRTGFPLLTTKKLHIRSILIELFWFLKGDTNIRYLQQNGVTIWDEWADEKGDLGPVYGHQWRKWDSYGHAAGIDQLQKLVEQLQKSPDSRRHIVTAWNPREVPDMKLPPCHCLWQCYVQDDVLSLHMYQRSCDSFLGLPFNIASYAFLTHMLATVCGLKVGDLIISFGDLHIYSNHFEQVKLQLSREPRPLPQLKILGGYSNASLSEFRYKDFSIEGYDPHPSIKAPIAV